jgi:hypothetical protein
VHSVRKENNDEEGVIIIIIITNYCILHRLLTKKSSKILYPRDVGISRYINSNTLHKKDNK